MWAYLARRSPGGLGLLRMVFTEPLIHTTLRHVFLHPSAAEACGEDTHVHLHVGAQFGDSVSPQVQRALPDGAGVASTRGELASSHLSARTVKQPVQTTGSSLCDATLERWNISQKPPEEI